MNIFQKVCGSNVVNEVIVGFMHYNNINGGDSWYMIVRFGTLDWNLECLFVTWLGREFSAAYETHKNL